MSDFRRAGFAALILLCTVATLFGCQRGEKSCRYYSIVLDRSESSDDRNRAIDAIKRMTTKDQLKCDDDKVFERLGKTMKDQKFRPVLIDALENLGRAGGNLRTCPPTAKKDCKRSEELLVDGMNFLDSAGLAAGVIRTWRLETAESGHGPWLPKATTADAIAAAIKKPNITGQSRSQLVEALFLSVPDAKQRNKYEDLLVELADADPASQTVETNIKALQYLAEMYRDLPPAQREKKDAAFSAFVHGIYAHDANRAETFMAARLALATMPPSKVADKVLGIFLKKDGEFEKWVKTAGLFDWEWTEGPKAPQILADLHDAKTASALIAAAGKPIDASEAGTPKTFVAVNKALPWSGYVTSRLQLTMWALAAMGQGLAPYAQEIANVAKTQGLAVEQRTMPFIGLSLSGAPNAWQVMAKAFTEITEIERADFLTPMSYAVDTQNLPEWQKIIDGDKSEGVTKGRADPTIVARIKVVTDCKTAEDAATDAEAKKKAVIACYEGFLKSGDDLAKEKAAVNLVHLAVRGTDLMGTLLEAFNKSAPTNVTLRQILMAGIKATAQTKDMKPIYQVQQEQIAFQPATQTFVWDFDVLLNHLLQKKIAEGGGGAMPVNIPAVGAAPATP